MGGWRLNQYAVTRLVTWGLGLVAAVFLATGMWLEPEIKQSQLAHRSPGEELTRILQRLRIAPDSRARERILHSVRSSHEQLVGPLWSILGQSEHPLLLEAIDCAGQTKAESLRPTLVELAQQGRPDIRERAIRAAEQLRPWPPEDLEFFLGDRDPGVQIAAISVLRARSDAPWGPAIELLADGAPAVQQAVIDALPSHLDPSAQRAFATLLDSASLDVLTTALGALVRTDAAGRFVTRASGLLVDGDARVQIASLQLMAGHALPDPGVVVELGFDFRADSKVRAAAFRCLERSRPEGLADVLGDRIAELADQERYFAARCLLVMREPLGYEVLLELADDEGSVANASRVILAATTGLGVAAEIEQFESLLEGADVAEVALPASPGF